MLILEYVMATTTTLVPNPVMRGLSGREPPGKSVGIHGTIPTMRDAVVATFIPGTRKKIVMEFAMILRTKRVAMVRYTQTTMKKTNIKTPCPGQIATVPVIACVISPVATEMFTRGSGWIAMVFVTIQEYSRAVTTHFYQVHIGAAGIKPVMRGWSAAIFEEAHCVMIQKSTTVTAIHKFYSF
jgi:hypothetical protein